MICFNQPPHTGKELDYIRRAFYNKKFLEMVNSQKNVIAGLKKNFILKNVINHFRYTRLRNDSNSSQYNAW